MQGVHTNIYVDIYIYMHDIYIYMHVNIDSYQYMCLYIHPYM